MRAMHVGPDIPHLRALGVEVTGTDLITVISPSYLSRKLVAGIVSSLH